MTTTASKQVTDPYAGNAAEEYHLYHRHSLRTGLTTYRERKVLQAALRAAGDNLTTLDLPCGAGRFWPVFKKGNASNLIAADASEGMLQVADQHRLTDAFPSRLFATSAFAIDLPENVVQFTACMRFYHHLSLPTDRLQVLSELRRVSRDYVAISLWVDGNLSARRRAKKTPTTPAPGFGRRVCRDRREVEAEFRTAGLEPVKYYDVWPKISMWRLYLLKCS
ncbi:MAG: class I SAM-dependent methyltransferase [Gammaproteobacteria bacterium]|nr:class I SAM-dependent methyltransferase [Gammaproteobacteria bacterium]